ncbi:MAG: CRISPR-associated endonuclease Cas3'' [Methylobacteriaceae bacterium]|nr:CRISPR-associated endonuclease Cas3'' [Methylobacteriaceae bacterium]
MRDTYAHSLPDQSAHSWEPLRDHLRLASTTCAGFAHDFGWGEIARVAGLLHDIGKCSAEFQAYIDADATHGGGRGPDHSTAGAREALRLYGDKIGRILAFIVAGHHSGLADGTDLERRLTKVLPVYDGWERHAGALPTPHKLAPTRRQKHNREGGFTLAFLIRMLFSCLVDADRLETADFVSCDAAYS